MDVRSVWSQVASEVLNEPSPAVARSLLAAALISATRAGSAARIQVLDDGRVSWFVEGAPAPQGPLPSGAQIMEHPLYKFQTESGWHGPAALTEVIRDGWRLKRETMNVIEQLGLTLHQMSVPVGSAPGAGYDGWVLVADEGFAPTAQADLAVVQALVIGLDRHITLLSSVAPPEADDGGLTPRETIVLALMAGGHTAHRIASRLQISTRTVHKHQENLYRKLGARNRLSAVLRAQGLGLLPKSHPEPGTQGPHSSSSAVHSSR